MTSVGRGGARFAATILLFVLSIAATGHAGMTSGYGSAAADEVHVLFIGNSLTYWNDLPSMLGRIAKENGRRMKTKAIAYPDFALFDHAEKGDAAKEIAKGGWDLVVMQQGPSGAPENRAYLIDYAKRFAVDIRKAGGRPALYQVWPSSDRAGDMDRVCESYRLAAEAVDGLLLPVGEAWKDALVSAPAIKLYSDDGLHPTVAGSLLAALVMYEGVFREPPMRVPRFDVPEAHVAILRATASRACSQLEQSSAAPVDAAIQAARQWTFEPAPRHRQPDVHLPKGALN